MILVSRRMLCVLGLIVQNGILFFMLLRGSYGYVSLLHVRKKNTYLKEQCKYKREEIKKIQLQIQEWKTIAFLQEKYAREKLHMGKKDEQVFFYE